MHNDDDRQLMLYVVLFPSAQVVVEAVKIVYRGGLLNIWWGKNLRIPNSF